jgi:hypothetical protein
VAQLSPREVSPSLLHTARVVTPVQVASPGLQVQSTQRPAVHDCRTAQGDALQPPPSGAQVSKEPSIAQRVAAGVQTTAWQRPSRQVWPLAQRDDDSDAPRVSQVRWVVVSAQLVAFGVQRWRVQMKSGAQNWPAAQSLSPAQSTHCISVWLHTRLRSEHSRLERQVRGAGAQPLRRHTCPLGQSRSRSQSTQTPSEVLQS